jgi:hypothetical protein
MHRKESGRKRSRPIWVNLGFLDRSRYFFLQVAPQLWLSGLRSRPAASQKIWKRLEIEPRTSGSVVRNSGPRPQRRSIDHNQMERTVLRFLNIDTVIAVSRLSWKKWHTHGEPYHVPDYLHFSGENEVMHFLNLRTVLHCLRMLPWVYLNCKCEVSECVKPHLNCSWLPKFKPSFQKIGV